MRQILKQTSWLVLGQALTRIVGFFYTIFLAKSLGVSDFGLFTVGLAYFSIISVIGDFGFNRYLIREISKEDGQRWKIICNLLMLRLTLVCLFFGIFSLFLYLFDQDKMRVSIILLSSLAVLPQTIAITFDGLFIALRKLQFSALAAVVSSLSTVLLGVFLVGRGFAVYGAVNALILGQLIFAITFLLLVSFHVGIKLAEVKLPMIKKTLKGSLPYGLLGILGFLYFKVDTILLGYLKGAYDTGIYGAAYKFLEAVITVPQALSVALFPVFATTIQNPSSYRLYIKTLIILFFISLPVMILFFLFSPLIVSNYLPQYLPSLNVINILNLSIPFFFMNSLQAILLLSNQKFLNKLIIISLFMLFLIIILNLLFIPLYSYLAAAWITVITEALVFVIFFMIIRKNFQNM